MGALFQLFFATGTSVSYWVICAVPVGIDCSSPIEWQILVGLQLVSGGLLDLGMLLMRESPR